MELGKNNYKYYQQPREKKKISKELLIFSGFLLVIIVIIFTTFYDGMPITGKAISSVNLNNSVQFSSELTRPDLNLKGEYSEINISFSSKTTIYLGEKSFAFDDSKENSMILSDFSGKIKIEGGGVILDGRVSGANLNGLPIKEKNDKRIKVSSDSKISYSSIDFKENLFLTKLDYIASGVLYVGEENQDSINLDKDPLAISDYLGKLKIIGETLFLEGFAENIDIEGNIKKISISK